MLCCLPMYVWKVHGDSGLRSMYCLDDARGRVCWASMSFVLSGNLLLCVINLAYTSSISPSLGDGSPDGFGSICQSRQGLSKTMTERYLIRFSATPAAVAVKPTRRVMLFAGVTHVWLETWKQVSHSSKLFCEPPFVSRPPFDQWADWWAGCLWRHVFLSCNPPGGYIVTNSCASRRGSSKTRGKTYRVVPLQNSDELLCSILERDG